MTDCHHPNFALDNVRTPSDGDALGEDGNLAVVADCGECGDTVMVRAKRVETLPAPP